MHWSLNGSGWLLTGWFRNQWRIARSLELGQMPVPAVASVPAVVPGSVQTDLMRVSVIPNVYHGLNSRAAEWVTNREWFYDRLFQAPFLEPDQRLYLHCRGLDHHGYIYLNHDLLGSFSGMFEEIDIDLSDFLRQGEKNLLRIVFLQPPEIDGQYGYTSRMDVLKARFNYVWDWCPRNVSVGIWDDVYLCLCRKLRLRSLRLYGARSESGSWMVQADIELEAFVAADFRFEFVISRQGSRLRRRLSRHLSQGRGSLAVEIEVRDPALWWPHGYGEQVLYNFKCSVRDESGLTCLEHKEGFGLRSVRLLPLKAASLPYALEINGRRIPIKGVNWVPLTPFFGQSSAGDYRRIVGMFRQMGCNILRVWGGGIIEKEAFYETCDRLGMLVWQEFPLSSSGIDNLPNQDGEYLASLRRVASSFVRRARNHPSHAIWCGGNELMYEDCTPVGCEHPTIRLLEETVAGLDRGKPFLPASPSGRRFVATVSSMGRDLHHDVHGPWKYLGVEEHYSFFNRDDALLRSELGCPAAAAVQALRFYSQGVDLWPPDASNPYWVHRGAWWLQLEEMTHLFGAWSEEEAERYVAFSRYLQAEALRYGAAATLGRWPEAAGLLVWMGNESFPNAANTSLVEFAGAAKPAYFALKRVFGRLFPALAYPRLAHRSGESLELRPFALRCGLPESGCSLETTLHDYGGRMIAASGRGGAAKRWRAPPADGCGVFFARQEAEDPEGGRAVETYPFCLAEEGRPPLEAFRRLPPCSLRIARRADRHLLVENRGEAPAVGLSFSDARIESPRNVDGGFLTLFPGESVELSGELASCSGWKRRLRWEALNGKIEVQLDGP